MPTADIVRPATISAALGSLRPTVRRSITWKDCGNGRVIGGVGVDLFPIYGEKSLMGCNKSTRWRVVCLWKLLLLAAFPRGSHAAVGTSCVQQVMMRP